MTHERIHVADVLRAEVLGEKHLETRAVAAADLISADERHWIAQALLAEDAALMAPRIYSVRSPFQILTMYSAGLKARPPATPPHETAIALCRQNKWRLSLPLAMAKFLLGLAERPLALPEIPYDQGTRRHYAKAGVTLIPADPSIFELSVAGQALTVGLPQDSSVQKLIEIGLHAARGSLGLPGLIDGLTCDIDADRLGERELITASSIIDSMGEIGLILRAPADWTPPASSVGVVKIEDWWIRRLQHPLGPYFCLAAKFMKGHPVLDGTTLAHSSPLIWVDAAQGYARTVSRIYQLGRRRPE